jgi:hypothetical protein
MRSRAGLYSRKFLRNEHARIGREVDRRPLPWRRTESVGGDNIEDIELSGN